MIWKPLISAAETGPLNEPRYDERYVEYIELFNERYFYDCHEVLEDLWLDNEDSSRRFYQGLIHLATAFQHLFRGNTRGCQQRFASTLVYLADYGDNFEGLDLASIRLNIQLWQTRLQAQRPPAYRDCDVPRLQLIG